jgi:hypothetical protein
VRNWEEIVYATELVTEGASYAYESASYPIRWASRYSREISIQLYNQLKQRIPRMFGDAALGAEDEQLQQQSQASQQTEPQVREEFVSNVYHITPVDTNTSHKLRDDLSLLPMKCCLCSILPSEVSLLSCPVLSYLTTFVFLSDATLFNRMRTRLLLSMLGQAVKEIVVPRSGITAIALSTALHLSKLSHEIYWMSSCDLLNLSSTAQLSINESMLYLKRLSIALHILCLY